MVKKLKIKAWVSTGGADQNLYMIYFAEFVGLLWIGGGWKNLYMNKTKK